MFIETIIAVFLLGLIVGAWLVELFRCDPLRAENLALKQRQAERSWEAEKDAIRYQAHRKHLGTPYISPDPTGLERLLADINDNDGWSRKAPDNVRSIGSAQ